MSKPTTVLFTLFLLSLIFSILFLVCVGFITLIVWVAKEEVEVIDSDLVSVEEDIAIFRLELGKMTVLWPTVMMVAAVGISLRQLMIKAEDEIWGYF